MSRMNDMALWIGPLVGAGAATACLGAGYGGDAATVAFVAVVCVVWWVF